jgi:hypothetical protein
VFTQDTTKPVERQPVKQDTTFIQNFIMADNSHQYLNKTSPDTLTRKRFLWYPTKSLEDVFNYLPGYYLFYMDVEQLNPVAYNQMTGSNNGVLRNGRPINDLIDGSIDWNLFSRNEISEIELSGGYGNNVYGYSNTVNIIQRQLFQFRPYTEISYYQDRYENLYFDGNFHQNLFETVNFNFGITKHSYDGHYTNSDFDKWLGRFNLTFAPTSKLNFFANVNYANIKKGLNEGIRADTVNLGSKDELFNSARAIVNNPDAYEKKERFDIDLGSVFLAGKSSFTKVQLYVSNSFREYRDEENRPTPNGIFIQNNYHWINYGAKLQQLFNFNFFKNTIIRSRTEIEYNFLIRHSSYLNYIPQIALETNFGKISFIENIDLEYKNFFLNGFIKEHSSNDFKYIYYDLGFKAQYLLKIANENSLKFNAGYNSDINYVFASVGYISGENSFSSEIYYYKLCDCDQPARKGINNYLKLRLFKFDFEGVYSYNMVPLYYSPIFENDGKEFSPKHYGNLSISWHDMAFRNKLEYKIGFNSRFWSQYYSNYYNSKNNSLGSPLLYIEPNYNLKIPANATLDFFIMGKIGKATFGITVENILDRIIYNTGVYPFMDRGGFLNSISRFNITWNFFD